MSNDHLLAFLKPEHTRFYINQIFKNVIDLEGADQIEVRKIGRIAQPDGTFKPFEESVAAGIIAQFGDSAWQDLLATWVIKRLENTAQHGHGAFMAPAMLDDRRANDNSVKKLLTVCADFDSGNPAEKLAALNARLGFRPTIVANSGGKTAEGFQKLHVHWRLSEPSDETWKVAYIRELIALQFGGDTSFKRIPQVIRIPGALYDKNGAWATTEIIEADEHSEVDLMAFEEVFEIDWNNLDQSSMWHQKEIQKSPSERKERMKQLQNEVITEGGSDTDNRWQRFSEFAGHQIRQARTGLQTVDEANASVHLWVENNMVPSWDWQRVENEFKQLLQRDRVNNSDRWRELELPKIQYGPAITNPAQPGAPVPIVTNNDEIFEIDTFDVGSLYSGTPPPVPYLIDNFLIDGSIHALVADGGVGKTYQGLELAMRVAAGPKLKGNYFLGFEVLKQCMAVVFTVEDSKDDIHRRLVALDPHGDLRKAAAGNCFVIPVQEQMQAGLTLVARDKNGNFKASDDWKFIVDKIEECRARSEKNNMPVLVILDTYSATHHGDENTSIGTNEWFRAAGLLKRLNATLWIMHHVKKANPDVEIKTPTDMRNNIRGSIAFANSCRIVYGIWPMPNSDSVMKELPTEDGNTQLFNMGMLKNNTGIDWSDRSDPRYKEPMITLRRTGSGQLLYDAHIHETRIELTMGKRERVATKKAQLKAALVHTVAWYADNAWALAMRSLTKDADRFLPAAVNDSAEKDIKKAMTELIKAGTIKEIKVQARGGSFVGYDVPTGKYALGQQVDRSKVTPVLEWREFRYDEEHCEYVKAPESGAADPDTSTPSQSRMDFTAQND